MIKRKETYKYTFADGSSFSISSTTLKEDRTQWIEILIRMDLDEAANDKKETRRHCSYEALGAEYMDLASDTGPEELITDSEAIVSFIRSLNDLEREVYIARFIDQLSQYETADNLNYTRARIAQVEKRIREKYKKF